MMATNPKINQAPKAVRVNQYINRKYFTIVERIVDGVKQLASFEWSSQSQNIEVIMFQMWTEFHRQVRPGVSPSDDSVRHVLTLFANAAGTKARPKWKTSGAMEQAATIYKTTPDPKYIAAFGQFGYYFPMKAKPRTA